MARRLLADEVTNQKPKQRFALERREADRGSPVVLERIESLVGERMIEEEIHYLKRHSADVGARLSRLHDVGWRTQRCCQHLRLETVVVIDLNDVAH